MSFLILGGERQEILASISKRGVEKKTKWGTKNSIGNWILGHSDCIFNFEKKHGIKVIISRVSITLMKFF